MSSSIAFSVACDARGLGQSDGAGGPGGRPGAGGGCPGPPHLPLEHDEVQVHLPAVLQGPGGAPGGGAQGGGRGGQGGGAAAHGAGSPAAPGAPPRLPPAPRRAPRPPPREAFSSLSALAPPRPRPPSLLKAAGRFLSTPTFTIDLGPPRPPLRYRWTSGRSSPRGRRAASGREGGRGGRKEGEREGGREGGREGKRGGGRGPREGEREGGGERGRACPARPARARWRPTWSGSKGWRGNERKSRRMKEEEEEQGGGGGGG